MKVLAIGICGILGVYSRYFLDKAIDANVSNFPYSTLSANLVGCFLVGFFYILANQNANSFIFPALIVGYCGGFTTFSSYSFQIFQMLNSGHVIKAFVYLTLSSLFGVLMVMAGMRGANTFLRS